MTTLRPFPGIRARRFSSVLCGAAASSICACSLLLAGAPPAHCQTQAANLTGANASGAPVPDSPMEMVTQSARLLTSQDERAAALALFDHARHSLALHSGAPAFQMKVSFMSSGQSQYEGDGSMEEISSGPRWRWTAQIGSSSQTHLSPGGGVAYSTNPRDPIPMRVQMVRSAIFTPIAFNLGADVIRTAEVTRDGKELTCMLLSSAAPYPNAPRQWFETEYCMDADTGLLRTWSEAPGIYIDYNYADAIHFAGRTIARDITVTEGNEAILQIHIDSLEPAVGLMASMFEPTRSMLADGPAFVINGPRRFPMRGDNAAEGQPSRVQPVIVHATLSNADGHVIEAEALPGSDPALSQEAVNLIEKTTFPANGMQQEVFVNVKYHVPQ
ncbi:MAG: hypothetical protein WA197_25030 [Candidatus Acidiferrales bacterium]